MQPSVRAEGCDNSQILARIDQLLEQQPNARATILKRLKEAKPELYTLWLMRTISKPATTRQS